MRGRSGHVALNPAALSGPANHEIGLMAHWVGFTRLRGINRQDSLSDYVGCRL